MKKLLTLLLAVLCLSTGFTLTAARPAAASSADLTVMTRNLYLGADVGEALKRMPNVAAAAQFMWDQVAETNFTVRSKALASEAAIGKAKVEKADRLVGALKTRMTKYRIDTARAACRFIVDNVRRRKAWEDNVSALQNQVNTATAVTHKLTTMRNGIEEALQANKDEILLEVCILGAGGRLGTRPRLSPIVHLDHGLQVIPTGMRDCIPTYDCVPLASVLHCLSQHKATCAAIQAEIDGLYHDRVELRVVKEKLKAEVSVTVCVVVVGGAKAAGILSWNHHCY